MIKKLFVPIFILCIISCDHTSSDGKKEDGGSKNGLVNTYNEDGSLSASIYYKNNLRHGLATDYYKDGKLRAEIDYVNGLKEGLAKWYHKNGKIFRSTAYIADQREYNKSGQERKSKAAFVFGEKIPLDDGTVKIEVRLNNKVKEVSIFQGSLKKGKFMHQGLVEINKTANIGYAIIPKGETEVSVVAKYKTRYKNYRVLHGKAKL